MEGVTPCGYQRRPAYEYRCETVSGTPWSLCATQEATDMFERVPGFEYRAIYDANTVLALARQAEALQRENAEKDAEIAKLREVLADSLSAFRCTQNVDRYPADHWCRRARALLGGENAE